MNRRREAMSRSSDEPPKKLVRTITIELEIPKRKNVPCMVLACGQGDMGQLGLGEDEMERKRPSIVGTFKNVVDIQAGGMHSLLLTAEGNLFTFGCNDEGALGRDSSEEGSEFLPQEVSLPGKCVRISAGDSHSACLLEDGRVFAWGSFRDSHGSMGLTLEGSKRLPVEVLPGIKSCGIASGADHLVILTCGGKVYTVGCGEQGQLGRVSLRTASGESRRGKLQLLEPDVVYIKNTRFADAIWATTYCTFVRDMKTKKIFGFGLNNYNQLALRKIGEPMIAPSITLLKNLKTVSGGQHHTLILNEDNVCSVIGRKDYGRLGLGKIEHDVEQLRVIEALSDKNVVDVSCGECQSFAITAEGHVFAWGMGSNLQLGTGNEDDEWEPVHIVSKYTKDSRIVQVSSGGQHTLFLARDMPNEGTKSSSTEPEKTNLNGNKELENEASVKLTEKQQDVENENGDKNQQKTNIGKKGRKK